MTSESCLLVPERTISDVRTSEAHNLPFPYIMSLTGDALYTPLADESMLPFWYLFGSAMV
jgi:hypothetical protein